MSTTAVTIFTNKEHYLPGEEIRGYIRLINSQLLLLSDIILEAEGSIKVEFTTSDGKQTIVHKTKYLVLSIVQSLLYYRHGTNGLVHGVDSAANTLYQPGAHELPFVCELPEAIPASYSLKQKGSLFQSRKKGLIAYSIRVSLVQPNAKEQKIFKAPFVVTHVPTVCLQPICELREQSLSYLCCISKGTLSVGFCCEKNVLAAGELVAATIEIDHTHARADILRLDLCLQKKHVLSVFTREDVTKSVEASTSSKQPAMLRGSKHSVTLKFQVPITTEPSFDSLNINVEYFLKLRVVLSRASNRVFHYPVTICAPE